MDSTKTLIFGGDWDLAPGESAQVLHRFRQTLRSKNLEASYRFDAGSQSFYIDCKTWAATELSQLFQADLELLLSGELGDVGGVNIVGDVLNQSDGPDSMINSTGEPSQQMNYAKIIGIEAPKIDSVSELHFKLPAKNVFFCGSRSNYQTIAVLFRDMGSKFMQTTLIDSNSIEVDISRKNFKRNLTLRLFKSDVPPCETPAISEADITKSLKVWEDYVYRSRGVQPPESLGKRSQLVREAAEEKRRGIENWTMTLPDKVLTNSDGIGDQELQDYSSLASTPPVKKLIDFEQTQQYGAPNGLASRNQQSHSGTATTLLIENLISFEPNVELNAPIKPDISGEQPARTRQEETQISSVPQLSGKIPTVTYTSMSESLRKEIDVEMVGILQRLHCWSGKITFEAQIGRIIISCLGEGLSGTYTALTNSKKPDEAKIYLSGSEDSVVPLYFTKMITTFEAEAQHIIDLQDSTGRRCWSNGKKVNSPKPRHSVVYEFRCEDRKTKSNFIIEVDAETFELSVRTDSAELGVINGHCLLRNWDFRLVATGSKDLISTHGDLARMIVDSLYIPSDLALPELQFALDTAQEYDFPVIRTYRKSQYSSSGEESFLNVTQVFEMSVAGRVVDGGQKKEYRAWCPPGKDFHRPIDEPTWIEMSISSPKAEKCFEQNERIRAGEEAAWKPEAFLQDGILSSIYMPACTLIQSMDGIGLYNNNGMRPPLHESSKKPQLYQSRMLSGSMAGVPKDWW